MNPLSNSQRDALVQASYIMRRDTTLYDSVFRRLIIAEPGWFRAGWGEFSDVSIRPQTCKSLCSRGLLEYRVEWQTQDDKLIIYRITAKGIQFLIGKPIPYEDVTL